MNEKVRVPLVHISRRSSLPWYKAWAIRAAAIVLALIVCGVITALLTGENPISIYVSMLDGAFGTSRRIWVLLQNIAILLCVSLAVTPAFKMRFWNIGGEGQIMAGCLAQRYGSEMDLEEADAIFGNHDLGKFSDLLSSLDAGRSDALNKILLQNEENKQHRNSHDNTCRQKRCPSRIVLRHDLLYSNRKGVKLGICQENQEKRTSGLHEQEVRPGKDGVQHRGGHRREENGEIRVFPGLQMVSGR